MATDWTISTDVSCCSMAAVRSGRMANGIAKWGRLVGARPGTPPFTSVVICAQFGEMSRVGVRNREVGSRGPAREAENPRVDAVPHENDQTLRTSRRDVGRSGTKIHGGEAEVRLVVGGEGGNIAKRVDRDSDRHGRS